MTKTDARPLTFVTGGCGFIGYALCHRLAAAGHQVVAYDDLSRGRRENLPDGARLIEGDITDPRLPEVLSDVRPQTVVHLAALHYLPECAARPDRTKAINVDGTRRVLDACRAAGVRGVVFASTAAVYAPADAPCSEDGTPVGPIEVYGESKLAGERLVEAFCRDTGVAATVLRISNAIGRRETNPHVVPHIFESLRASNTVPLGNLEAQRDYIDTRDVARAMEAVLGASAGYQVFNVGTGVAHSVADIVATLRRILDRPIEIRQDPARLRPVERRLLVSDVGRIRRATGWTSRMVFEETLRDLVEFYGLAAGGGRNPDDAHPTSTPSP